MISELEDRSTLPKYVTAFADSIHDGSITPDHLLTTSKEITQFETLLKVLVPPVGILRKGVGILPSSLKNGIGYATRFTSDAFGVNFTEAVGKVLAAEELEGPADVNGLNNQQFRLSGDGQSLRPLRNASERPLHELFPEGQKNEWPTLALVANSDLSSPQNFFDSCQAAKTLIPEVTHASAKHLIVAGTYCTERSFAANMAKTVQRFNVLTSDPDSMAKVKTASHLQSRLLASVLLRHSENGSVITETGPDGKERGVLRSDAADILKHVISFGYSGGHLRNKDAFRIIREGLRTGQFAVEEKPGPHAPEGQPPVTHISGPADANKLLPNARAIGIAGADPMQLGQESDMPKEVNFLSRGDQLLSLNGTPFVEAPGNLHIKNPQGGDFDKPLESTLKGHELGAQVDALLDKANSWTRGEANQRLTGRKIAI